MAKIYVYDENSWEYLYDEMEKVYVKNLKDEEEIVPYDEDFLTYRIKGTSSGDKIDVDAYGSTKYGWIIDAKGGNDNITFFYSSDNSENGVHIDGGSGNDSIKLSDCYGDVFGNNGNDKIEISSFSGAVIGARGNDTIIFDNPKYSSFYYINGDGNDVVSIEGGDYRSVNFSIKGNISGYKISGVDHIISIGKGSITFKNVENGVKNFIDGRSHISLPHYIGKDYKFYYGVEEDDEDDWEYVEYIDGRAFTSVYDYKDGDNFIYEKGVRSTINGYKGDDYIIVGALLNVIKYSPGDGNDTIYANGYCDSIYDTVVGNNLVQYLPNIQITDNSSYALVERGDDVIIKVKSATATDYDGSMILKKARGKALPIISGGTLDTLNSFHYLKGTSGADSINNTVSSMLINTYDGNDYILTGNTSNVTVNAAEGNDYIYSYSSNSKINLGAGNDTIIQNGGENVTIYSGSGDDVVSLSSSAKGSIIQYANGDGNDIIYNYDGNSTLQIAGEYSTLKSNNNVIITVDDGSLTLMSTRPITPIIVTVEAGSFHDDDTIPTEEIVPNSENRAIIINTDPATYTASSTIITIDGSARTKKVNITGNINDNIITGGSNHDTINSGAGDDTLNGDKGNDKLLGEAGNDVLEGGKGNDNLTGGAGADIFLYTSGDGKDIITDYTAGEDRIQLKSGTIKKVAADKKGNLTFTIDKGSIKLNGAAGKKVEIIDGDGNTLFNQIAGINKITVTDEDNETISASIDASIITIDGSTRTEDMTILANAKNNLIQLGIGNSTITTGKGKDTITYVSGDLNITDFQSGADFIKLSDTTITSASVSSSAINFTTSKGIITVNGAINKRGKVQKVTFANLDNSKFNFIAGTTSHTIQGTAKADTLSGTTGNDVLKGSAGNDIFIFSSGNDTIADYSVTKKNADAITLASDLVYEKHYITGKKSKDVLITFKDQSSETTTLTLLNAKGKLATINGTVYDLSDPTAKVFKKTDTITNYEADSDVITINATNHATGLNIIGNSNNNVIKGSAKIDTINGGSGNDTITSGKGKDLIIHTGGNDVITDYAPNQDIIDLNEATVTSLTTSGNDLKITTVNGTITLSKAAKKQVTLTTNGLTSNMKIGTKTTIVDSKGNDTLFGTAGADAYNYTGGNDVITDYTASDEIVLANKLTITNGEKSGTDYKLTTGSGSITIKNVGDTIITVKDSKGNSTKYNESSAATSTSTASAFFEEHWFTEDNNFINDSVQIDSILKDDSDIAVDYKFNDEKQSFKQILHLGANTSQKIKPSA